MSQKYIVKTRKTTPFGPFQVDDVVLQVVNPDGSRREQRRICLERGDSAAVLVHDKVKDEVVLVRQFRYPALASHAEESDGWVLEIPAGVIEPHEEPDVAARREVAEELGVTLYSIEHVSTFFVSPGGTSERIILFYALVGEASRSGFAPSPGEEDLETERLSVDIFMEKVLRNEIRDAKTLIAGFWLRDRLRSEPRPRG